MEQFVKYSLQKTGINVKLASLMACLKKLGVEQPSDVIMLTEADFSGVLTVIQARKLLAHWSSVSDANERTSEETGSSGAADSCAIFIDDSNIFIESQKYYARNLKLRVPRDPRCRLDIGKLVDLALGGRTRRYGKLYGSEPPALDTVWKKIRERGLEVDVFRKNFKGKEKEVDTSLTADAVEYALESKASQETVIIIAGDRDYRPLVTKLLDKKPGWKVELFAFRSSISREMRKIKNENLKIIEFESLPQEHRDMCCFVEARWRADLYRIPNNKTIILHFKTRLIPPEVENIEKKLKDIAVEITRITGVPCRYHLRKSGQNAGRWVYIIGYTWVKTERGDSGIDFIRICGEKTHLITQMCTGICQSYETFQSAMTVDDATLNAEFTVQLQNRFVVLPVEDARVEDDDLLSHIYDDDDVALNAAEILSQDDTETKGDDSDVEVEGAHGGFTEVKLAPKARKHRTKYCESCQFDFTCYKGLKCDYTHTDEQINFFKRHDGKGRAGYKSKPCKFFFEKGMCNHGPKSNNPNCPYYHSVEEARCYVCKNSNPDLKFIGHASHDETCPSKQ